MMDRDEPDSLATVQARSFRHAGAATRAAFPEERALRAGELEAFLARKRYAVLSTARADGRPHASMILFLLWNGRFWLPSLPNALRLRNLAHQPWASLIVSEGEGAEHIVVIVEGPTVVHDRVGEVLEGGLAQAWRERVSEPLDWVGALIELRPRKLLSYGPSHSD